MTTTPDTMAPAGRSGAATARWLMLIALLAGQFMGLLDVTITNVAMPAIGRSLHASGAELQLVIAGYTVSYATLLITGARLGDLAGRRRMFLAGTAIFTFASLTCGLAPDIGVLIGARFVQGAGAAAMMPQVMSVIQVRFSGAERARALSAYTAVLSSGFVAGQVIGGTLVTANLFGTAWRPVFIVNVPIGLAVLAAVPRLLPADKPAATRRLDLPGLAVAVPAVCLIVLPLMLGHQIGWPPWTFACIGLGSALAAVFIYTERTVASRGGDPLLRLAVLRSPGLVPGLATIGLIMIPYGGFLFSFSIHLQAGLGATPLRAGLTFAPSAAVFGLFGYFWRRLPGRAHHLLPPAGCAVAAASYAVTGLVLRSGTSGGAPLLLILVVYGAALALAFSPLMVHSLVGVPPSSAADASGLVTTALQLGQAIGVAVFGSIFLTLDARGAASGPAALGPQVSGHAIAVTAAWLGLATAAGILTALPLSRTVRAMRPGPT